MNVALITGISGQDGLYLTDFLLKKIIKLLVRQEIIKKQKKLFQLIF